MPRTPLMRATFAGLALTLGLGVALPAQAQEGTLLRDIFGRIGIMEPEQPQIEYRERAPLVVPPSRDLPPPRPPEQVGNAPDWPEDRRDRIAREEQMELERFQERAGAGGGISEDMPNFRLPRGTGRVPVTDPNDPWGDEPPEFTREQREAFQRQMRGGDDAEAQGLTRRRLTDPPSRFLQPAPTD